MITTTRGRRDRRGLGHGTSRRGNYDSGEDFVLEYGELRFTFNEQDFAERCEQAALKLGFVGGRLGEDELEDLVNLAVNGEIFDPASALGEHVNECWPELSARPTARSCTGCAGSCSAAPGSTSASPRASCEIAFVRRRGASPTCSPIAEASRSSSPQSPPGAGSPTGARRSAAARLGHACAARWPASAPRAPPPARG